jgi:hypothetical protein
LYSLKSSLIYLSSFAVIYQSDCAYRSFTCEENVKLRPIRSCVRTFFTCETEKYGCHLMCVMIRLAKLCLTFEFEVSIRHYRSSFGSLSCILRSISRFEGHFILQYFAFWGNPYFEVVLAQGLARSFYDTSHLLNKNRTRALSMR